jgi:hypothetical protein
MLSVLDHAVDVERRLQVDLHDACWPQHLVRDAVRADDAAVGRVYPYVQIIECRVPPRALRRIGAAQRVGVREDPSLSDSAGRANSRERGEQRESAHRDPDGEVNAGRT